MLGLRKIAVTGGLASGKSSVCRFFKELGAYVVSSDEIVHHLLSPETHVGRNVIDLLGSEIVLNHQIDRSRIAKKVFNNSNLLKSLERLLHPAVREEIENQYQAANKQGTFTLFVAEIPLLFESNDSSYDYTITVIADKKICQERFIEKTGYNPEEYDRRMSRQLDPQEKAKRADFLIYNDGDLSHLKDQVLQIYQKIIIFDFNLS